MNKNELKAANFLGFTNKTIATCESIRGEAIKRLGVSSYASRAADKHGIPKEKLGELSEREKRALDVISRVKTTARNAVKSEADAAYFQPTVVEDAAKKVA